MEAPQPFTTDDLRAVRVFDGLSDEQLGWFCEHGIHVELAPGERLFERGTPGDFMAAIVSGTIERYEEIGGQRVVVATIQGGQVTGMLPFSRMTRYPGNVFATEPTRVLLVRKADFPAMLAVSWDVVQRLVAQMSDRVRRDVRFEQQQEKLMALGRLSAGLAHELNNPAAAVRRASATLSAQLAKLPALVTTLARLRLDEAAIQALGRLPALVRTRPAPALSALARHDREEELLAWLEDRGIPDGWEMAGTFADVGVDTGDLGSVEGEVEASALGAALHWLECVVAAERLATEIGSSAERISTLIGSVKSYSHMDRSAEHRATDVREGLDNTLTMLSHKIKGKSIRLAREYPQDLPTIPANAGELNQVWTNLIDNAIDAMTEGGELRIEVKRDEDCVQVHVVDDGPGIPDDVRPRIFDPFFTTKGVGEGSGLGLDIALRIVRTHQGRIDVKSKAGRTDMCVSLPVSRRGGA